MFFRPFHPTGFLRSVFGSEPFEAYCETRRIPFTPGLASSPRKVDRRQWVRALGELSPQRQHEVELELAQVNEMAGPEAIAHFLDIAEPCDLPPSSIASGPPMALWFLLHRPDLFHHVFFHQEIASTDSWHHARAARSLTLDDLPERAAVLSASLKEFFQIREGRGQFCAVEGYEAEGGYCIIAQVADRTQWVNAFTVKGRPTAHPLRPALPVFFVYRPQDGAVLLKSHLRAHDRVADLFQRFGTSVLRSPVTYRPDLFHLNLLKGSLPLPPEGEDMEAVRVKALHLRYPERDGRRQVSLETVAGDKDSAIHELLAAHGGDQAILEQLQVAYAELEVVLQLGGKSKRLTVRLWPNRSNLTQTPLGKRLHRCLQRWGLEYAG